MIKNSEDVNLDSLIEMHRSEEKCRAYLEELRWPDEVICPRCGAKSISRIHKRGQYNCKICRYQFSVTSGTALHDSHLPLWKWFTTVYVMIESKKGISANQVKRTIGVSYKTAWYLCHRIRAAISEAGFEKSDGIVEGDEPRAGGKTNSFGRGPKENKTIVVYPIKRGDRAVLQVVDGAAHKTLQQFIRENRSPDEARDNVKPDNNEIVWSLLKRSIFGSYHKLSTKHLDAYLKELEWRHNNRENPYLFRAIMLKLITADNLPYQVLIH